MLKNSDLSQHVGDHVLLLLVHLPWLALHPDARGRGWRRGPQGTGTGCRFQATLAGRHGGRGVPIGSAGGGRGTLRLTVVGQG